MRPAIGRAWGRCFQLVREVIYLKSGQDHPRSLVWHYQFAACFASAHRLLALNRHHWAIENKLHYCRMSPFMKMRAPCGHAAQAIAVLNNLVLGCSTCAAFQPLPRLAGALPLEALALVLYAFV